MVRGVEMLRATDFLENLYILDFEILIIFFKLKLVQCHWYKLFRLRDPSIAILLSFIAHTEHTAES